MKNQRYFCFFKQIIKPNIDNPDNSVTWDIVSTSGTSPGNKSVKMKLPDEYDLQEQLIKLEKNIQEEISDYRHIYSSQREIRK